MRTASKDERPALTRPVRRYRAIFISTVVALVLTSLWMLTRSPLPANPIQFRVEFGTGRPGTDEPLLVTGRFGAADFLLVRYVSPGVIQFQYDNWGRPGQFSNPIPIERARSYQLEVHFPSLDVDRFPLGPPRHRSEYLRVSLNGREVFSEKVHFYPVAPGEVYFGRNPFSSTPFGPTFTGRLTPDFAVTSGFRPQVFLIVFALVAIAAGLATRGLRANLPFLVCLFPCCSLLDITGTFTNDWYNHLWLAAWHGSYLAQNFVPPEVVHTPETVGLVLTVFYGHWFYTVAGIVGALVGTDLAVRLILYSCLLLQFFEVRCAVRRITGSEYLAATIATLTTWSIYPITNLYQRSSLTEFTAAALITAALARIVLLSLRDDRSKAFRDALAVGLYAGPVALTHPITAMLGYPVLAITSLIVLVVRRRESWLPLLLAGAASVAMILPWLYVVEQFRSQLSIVVTGGARPIYFEINSFWVQLFPLPIDPRSVKKGLDVSTPYLNAQVNTPLLILILLLAGHRLIGGVRSMTPEKPRRRIGVLLILAGSGIFLLSLAIAASLGFGSLMPAISGNAQFAYRFVNGCNFGLVLACCGLLLTTSIAMLPADRVAAIITLTIAFLGVLLQQVYAQHLKFNLDYWRTLNRVQSLSPNLVGERAYSTQTVPEVGAGGLSPVAAQFRPQIGRFSPTLNDVEITTPNAGFVKTNVSAFPWNKILVNQREVEPDTLAQIAGFYAIRLSAGTHRLRYEFRPTRTWRYLQKASWFVFFALLVAYLSFDRVARTLQRRRHPGKSATTSLD